jgi:hypothetical protein
MARAFRLSRTNLILMLLNVLVLGGCIVLFCLRGPSGRLILLTIGVAGMAFGKVATGFMKCGK